MRGKKAIRNTEAAHLQKDIDHAAESQTFLDIFDKDSTYFKFDHDAIRADFFKIYIIINKFAFNNSLPRDIGVKLYPHLITDNGVPYKCCVWHEVRNILICYIFIMINFRTNGTSDLQKKSTLGVKHCH